MPAEGPEALDFNSHHEKLLKADDELIREKFVEIFASHYDDRLV